MTGHRRKQSWVELALDERVNKHGLKMIYGCGEMLTSPCKWERLETKKSVQCDSVLHVCGYVYVYTHTLKEKKIEKKGTKMLIVYPGKEEC